MPLTFGETSTTGTCSDSISNILRVDKCGGVYVIFLVVILAIFFYWALMVWVMKKDMVHNDVMNQKVFTMNVFPGCCSWWPVTHFILFFIIGLFYPNCGVVAMVGGALWELWETLIGSLTPKEKQNGTQNTLEYSQWWSGSIKDLAFNFAGFYSAKLIRYMWDNSQ